MCDKPKVDTSAQERQQAEAERARREEEARQRRIAAGMGDIAAIFEGGRYRSGTRTERVATDVPGIERVAGAPAPRTDFRGGEADQPVRTGGGGATFRVGDKTFKSREAAQEYRRGLPRFKKVEKPVFSRSKGTQPFLDQRRGALEDYYYPQVDEQFDDASDETTFALSRSGLLNSTVASDKRTDLSREFSLAAAKIASDIDADITNTASRFERERQAQEAALRASGDRSAAAEASTRGFANISEEPPSFSILPDLFGGVASSIGTYRQAQENADISRRISEVINPISRREGRVVGP